MLKVEQQQDDDRFEHVDRAAERYWLQGMDLGYAKRRALVEATREEMPQQRVMFPIVRF